MIRCDRDVRRVFLDHLQNGVEDAHYGAEGPVFILGKTTEAIEMAEKLVCAVDQMDDHTAVSLEDLRQSLGLEIPLAWTSDCPGRVAAIEVYPAATRLGLGLPKVPKGEDPLEGLQGRLHISPAVFLGSEHVQDAVLCALGGLEFMLGRSHGPTAEQRPQATKEGWIWTP